MVHQRLSNASGRILGIATTVMTSTSTGSTTLRTLALIAATGCVAAVTERAIAHHSFAAEYDSDQPVDIRGAIAKTRWANPHTRVYVDVKAPDGTVTTWGIEFGAPNFLEGVGLKKSDVMPGTRVEIKGYRAKNGGPWAYSVTLILDDGRTFATGTASDAPPPQAAEKSPSPAPIK
jgi:hypothetical protein